MSDGVTLKLVGDKRLLRQLQRIPAKDAKAALRKGTRAGAKIILPVAKAKAPRRRKKRGVTYKRAPGTLRKSLRVRATKRSRRYIGITVMTGKGFFQGEAFYAGFVEFGTQHMEGQHFMQEAARQVGPKALDTARRITRDTIVQLAKRPG